MQPIKEKAGSLPAPPPEPLLNTEAKIQKNDSKVNGTTKSLVKDWQKYVRIKTDYYKTSYNLTSKGDKVPELIIWKKTTIREDHGNYIIKEIRENGNVFENFANVPDNDPESYKRKIHDCYNLYEPINWKPEKGNCDLTIDFLHHIFGDKYELAIDWITLVYRNPTQLLPAIGLVSKENTTGKTTFLKWKNAIYGANSVILGNEDLSTNFNSPWANKLIIGVDETVIEKNIVKEKVKRLVTEDRILVERKGVDKTSIPFIGKFIMLSNNEHNFIRVDQEDTRFFVCKVPVIKKKDPNLLDKLIKEIPAFLHFIKFRELNYPEKMDRLWFEPKEFETDALKNMIENSKSRTEKELLDWFERVFNADESKNEILVSLSNLKEEIGKEFKNPNLRNDLEKVLKDNWSLIPEKQQRYDSPSLQKNISYVVDFVQKKEIILVWTNENGRPYRIKREYIFSKISN